MESHGLFSWKEEPLPTAADQCLLVVMSLVLEAVTSLYVHSSEWPPNLLDVCILYRARMAKDDTVTDFTKVSKTFSGLSKSRGLA